MTEDIPPTSDESRQLSRSLTEKVLDRAASDPLWKQQLLDDPEAAMREANFPETQRIQELGKSAAEASQAAEVRGQGCPVNYTFYYTYSNCCRFWTIEVADLRDAQIDW